MEIDKRNKSIIQKLFWSSESTAVINPFFLAEWLEDYKKLDAYLKVFNSGDVMLSAVESYNQHYTRIDNFYKNNEACYDALQDYPGEKDEMELLKWICRYYHLMNELTSEIITLLEDFEIEENENSIIFKCEIGENIKDIDGLLDFGHVIVLSTELYKCEFEPMRYAVNFCEFIWDLYFKKLEQYKTISEDDVLLLPEDHSDKVNNTDLKYHLNKRGIYFD